MANPTGGGLRCRRRDTHRCKSGRLACFSLPVAGNDAPTYQSGSDPIPLVDLQIALAAVLGKTDPQRSRLAVCARHARSFSLRSSTITSEIVLSHPRHLAARTASADQVSGGRTGLSVYGLRSNLRGYPAAKKSPCSSRMKVDSTASRNRDRQ